MKHIETNETNLSLNSSVKLYRTDADGNVEEVIIDSSKVKLLFGGHNINIIIEGEN